MALKEEKIALQTEVERMKADLEKAKRRLTKLEKVQDLDEPEVGTVLRFTRTLAGSATKYTFVAIRVFSRLASSRGWYVAGKKTTLNLIGLTETGNTWEDLLVAIGDSPVEVATRWVDPKSNPTDEPPFLYYRGLASNKVFRVNPHEPDKSAEVRRSTRPVQWRPSPATAGKYVIQNPGSYKLISKADAETGPGSAQPEFPW